MAAGDFTLFGAAIENIARGLIDLDGHSFKALLATSSYTPNASTTTRWPTSPTSWRAATMPGRP